MARFYRVLLVVTVLLLVSLACNLGAPRPSTPTPALVNPGAGGDQTTPQATGEPSGGEQVEVVLDEAQLTAIVNTALQSQENAPIEDAQVQLQNGQLEFTGQTTNQPIQAEVHAVMTVQVDQRGQLDLEFVSAEFGPFPVPGTMLDEIESNLEGSLQDELQSQMPGVRLEDIIITDGEMTFVGRTV